MGKQHASRALIVALGICGLVVGTALPAQGARRRMTPEERIQTVLTQTQPLTRPLEGRLPLYVWAVMDVPGDEKQIEATLKDLYARGIAACATWRPGKHKEATLSRALKIGTVQKRLGLRVNINANACTYTVFDGSPETAHVDADGNRFFDTLTSRRKLGCPFAVRGRFPAMREQLAFFLRAYKAKSLPIDFVFADWEVDGPIEWNGGWNAAKRCTRCRKHIPKIDDFRAFQKAYRTVRCDIQRECYAKVVLESFPKALVGNYGVHPHDGYRYWYDYFEGEPQPGVPVRTEHGAKYRPWFDEFAGCGFTFAMPVVYTRERHWLWYRWPDSDFRWFYNMLLTATNAGRHTPRDVPVISFVHYTTLPFRGHTGAKAKQMSTSAYKELLWHMLLRGHDAFFLWCPDDQIAREIKPLHEVWAASLEYNAFIRKGTPVAFDVPKQPGAVVSAIQLGDRLLVRRTDFTESREPVPLRIGEATVSVPRVDGRCQVLELP